eukprot:TRINITY_DN18798_c1_g2_i3.p1 TRINITY_DN18798_c1_g2~~TRINITY_DN18798_c1_g2_i3.p1  ORF type:complete len:535 (-),score=62.14 TRINITY_DN18798_c1_g2_i3:249-1853(-)
MEVEDECIGRLRQIVANSKRLNNKKSEQFFVEKLYRLTEQPEDSFHLKLAQCKDGQWHKIVSQFEREEEQEENISSKEYFERSQVQLQSYYGAGQYNQALNLAAKVISKTQPHEIKENELREDLSMIYYYEGCCYAALEKRQQAVESFMKAVQLNAFCEEALGELFDKKLINKFQEKELINNLYIEEEHFQRHLIEIRCRNYYSGPEIKEIIIKLETQNLAQCTTVVLVKTELLLRMGSFKKSFEITSEILNRGVFYMFEIVPYHCVACLGLGKRRELFQLGNELMQIGSERAISWFAVGCYYMCIEQYTEAEKAFQKATTLDANLWIAWLGYAESFAMRDGNDQAMTIYYTLSRMFPGFHQPMLIIGRELMKARNQDYQAELSLKQSQIACPHDPHTFNEIGVLFYHRENYESAESYFTTALDMVKKVTEITKYWEPTIVNRAHCLRKIGKYAEAVRDYEKALTYVTDDADTYAALGFTHHLNDDIDVAIQYYHKALTYKQNHKLATEMLLEAHKDSVSQFIPTLQIKRSGGN